MRHEEETYPVKNFETPEYSLVWACDAAKEELAAEVSEAAPPPPQQEQ